MINSKFGRLLVVSSAAPYVSPRGTTYKKWHCKCLCGNTKSIRESSLLSGDTTSCGCYNKEVNSRRLLVHGNSSHPLFNRWLDMHRRCEDETRKDFKHYGGRGVSVCDEWTGENGFANFLSDMEESFSNGLELDRIDVNGNYSKNNCRWVTRRIQVINRRPHNSTFSTRFIDYNGERLCISELAEKYGIPHKILRDRIGKLKWDIDKALTTPIRETKRSKKCLKLT